MHNFNFVTIISSIIRHDLLVLDVAVAVAVAVALADTAFFQNTIVAFVATFSVVVGIAFPSRR